jgi:phage terminase small subunit
MDAPKHLSPARTNLWNRTTANFTLEETELELLRLACETLDRAEDARLILAKEGIVSTGRYRQKLAHPAVAIERDSRLAAARIFKQLALPQALGESVSPLQLRPRRRTSGSPADAG